MISLFDFECCYYLGWPKSAAGAIENGGGLSNIRSLFLMVTSFFNTLLLRFAFRMKLQKVIHSKVHLIDANILCAGFLSFGIGFNTKSFQKFSPGPSFS